MCDRYAGRHDHRARPGPTRGVRSGLTDQPELRHDRSPTRASASWFLIGAGVAVFIMWTQARAFGGWSALLSVGQDSGLLPVLRSEIGDLAVTPFNNDGQITYAVALDPSGSSLTDLVPQASLRWRRILFPGVAGLFGRLDGTGLLWSLIAWQVLSLGLASAALRDVARQLGASPWVMIGLLANPGVWTALRIMTPDPMGLAFSLLGLALVLRQRSPAAAAAFALGALAKEPFFAFAAASAAWLFFEGRRRESVVVGAIPAVALVAVASLMQRFVPGSAVEAGNVRWPFVGMWRALDFWTTVSARDLTMTIITLALVIGGAVGIVVARHALVRWQLAAWVGLAAITSEWVWRFGNSSLRGFASLGVLVALALGIRRGPTHEP